MRLSIRVILCDLGNVVINFDHRIAARRILPYTDRSFEEICRFFFDSRWTKDFEEGRLASMEFFRLLKKALAFKDLAFKEFTSIWNEIFCPNPPMGALLDTLKKHYRLHLISNINKLHYDYIVQTFPGTMAVFDKKILSYKVGVRKPHPRIYRAAIEAAGFRRQEAVYTDDRLDLIEEAKRIGISSVVFKNVCDLRTRLRALGVHC